VRSKKGYTRRVDGLRLYYDLDYLCNNPFGKRPFQILVLRENTYVGHLKRGL